MIRSLSIENYRLFRDFRINELAPVNLCVGKNNTGKTSFLEAVGLLAHLTQREADIDSFLALLLHILKIRGEVGTLDENNRRTNVYELRHIFPGHRLGNKQQVDEAIKMEVPDPNSPASALRIRLEWKQDSPNGKSGLPEKLLVLSANESVNFKLTVTSDGDYVDRSLKGNRLAKLAGQNVHFITTYQSLNRDYVAHMWDRIQLTPREDHVIRMLQILEPRIERIAFKTADSGILVKLTGKEPVPLGSLGNGLNRIFDLALSLVSATDGYLFVDEIDTGLHYRAITDLWRLVFEAAQRLNVQVFATTHSWDCIESFAEAMALQEDEDIGALFRLQRANEQIKAIRYSADELQVATREEIEVR